MNVLKCMKNINVAHAEYIEKILVDEAIDSDKCNFILYNLNRSNKDIADCMKLIDDGLNEKTEKLKIQSHVLLADILSQSIISTNYLNFVKSKIGSSRDAMECLSNIDVKESDYVITEIVDELIKYYKICVDREDELSILNYDKLLSKCMSLDIVSKINDEHMYANWTNSMKSEIDKLENDVPKSPTIDVKLDASTNTLATLVKCENLINRATKVVDDSRKSGDPMTGLVEMSKLFFGTKC